jgi:hypothetical protein
MPTIRARIRRPLISLGQWPAERWIALSSMIIALSALELSILEFRAARWQARASVQPHFGISFYWDDTGAGWRDFNNGLGAARIRGFRLLVDGIPQPADDTYKIIARALGLGIKGATISAWVNIRVGTLIKADSSEELFWLKSGPGMGKLFSSWKRISFETCYCSIYDECWISTSDQIVVGLGEEDPKDNTCSPFSRDSYSRWWAG